MTVELPTLAGARCTLRGLRLSDALSLQRHADDEAVWRNLFEGFPRPYTMADAELWCGGQSREPQFGHVWGIEHQGEVVGCIGLVQQPGWFRCNAEVGYWLGQAVWRRGLASEAMRRVTEWAWQALPEVTRLFAPIFSWNEGSQAVARKCGYVLEARMPKSAIKAGRVIDRVVYAAYRGDAE